MRHATRPLVLSLLVLAFSGCVDEKPLPGPDAATAAALLPSDEVLGEPAAWGSALGQGRHEVEGTPELFLAFAVETQDPETSRLVDGLYNMREHVRHDAVPADGAAPHWLYQHRDATEVTMQRVASADGASDGAAWGAAWDWSYWGLGSVERPVHAPWIDSSEAAARVADHLPGWGEAHLDHLYLLYVPANESAPHWLLGVWTGDGTERRHAVVRATDGAVRGLDEVHPESAETGREEGTLVEGAAPEGTHHLEPKTWRDRVVVRVTPQIPDPVTGLTVGLDHDGWEETTSKTLEDGTRIVALRSLGGGPVDITVGLQGPTERYTLDWCSDGRFNDILGREPHLCDPLLA